MSKYLKYRKKVVVNVIAVQLSLDTEGFVYYKWGGEQRCKRGDWIVNNQGETYTVDQQSFAATYRQQSPGLYVKTTPVWALLATQAGSVKTKEGESHYQAGDYIVCNNEDGSDAYYMSATKFESLYERDN